MAATCIAIGKVGFRKIFEVCGCYFNFLCSYLGPIARFHRMSTVASMQLKKAAQALERAPTACELLAARLYVP
jgi:hypothetical protein